jgi:hypothetical protein
VADIAKKQKEAIAGMKKDGLISFRMFNRLGSPKQTVKAYTNKYDRVYKTYGGKAKAATFRPLAAQSKVFASALEQAGKISRLPKQARYNAPRLTAAAKKKYSKEKLHKVRSINKGWKVKKNALGTPVSRSKWGFAVVQVKGDDFCRIIQGEVYSKYRRGKPQRGVWKTHNNSFRVGACK